MAASQPFGRIAPLDLDANTVVIDRHTFSFGEKYAFLELEWVVCLAHDSLPPALLDRFGETRPRDEEWNELRSNDGMLVSSHPVLVALGLRSWWQRNGRKAADPKAIPTIDEAVDEVRRRTILNDCNEKHAGTVPGLCRWS
jgi:hypothetical protein